MLLGLLALTITPVARLVMVAKGDGLPHDLDDSTVISRYRKPWSITGSPGRSRTASASRPDVGEARLFQHKRMLLAARGRLRLATQRAQAAVEAAPRRRRQRP